MPNGRLRHSEKASAERPERDRERQTIDLIGSAPARMAEAQTDVRAGALSIRPFQVSRWRLRRTRHLWVFNGGLVLGYGLERGFWERMDRPFGGLIAGGEGGYFGDFGVLLVMRSGEASTDTLLA